jgi:transcriptional regulator GlxA family with amidase domain
MPTNVAIVLFPDVEELDFAGPYEVFGMFSKWVDRDWSVFTVAETKQVRGSIGLNVTVDHTFGDAPKVDVLVVPGGLGTRAGADNEALVGYIRRVGAEAQYVTSVCTGAFLLHRAGFLEGRKATTHWGSRDQLQKLGVDVVAERWVHDGNVVTAAGVSAGIDMALYVVGQMAGPEAARRTQHLIEYDPAPPYADVPLPA